MTAAGDPQTWKRLGELLAQRRVDLDVRYANLTRFSADRGLDYRLAWDVEHGARDNYRRPTLAAIESAYQLEPRSIEAYLASGQFLVTGNPYEGDPDLAEVWEKSRGLDLAARHGLVAVTRRARGERGNGGSGHGETRKQA